MQLENLVKHVGEVCQEDSIDNPLIQTSDFVVGASRKQLEKTLFPEHQYKKPPQTKYIKK